MTPDEPPVVRLAVGRPVVLAPFRRSSDGAPPHQPTRVEILDDGARLDVRFDCVDTHPWATLTRRDADLWTEEVVELFVAPGPVTPSRYYEVEVNPLGTLFDAEIGNRRGDRSAFEIDRGWSCTGVRVSAERTPRGWRAGLSLPWRSISNEEPPPRFWRLNLYRIDRPEGSPAEYSAWSPTFADPPDFHHPARFGLLERLG